MIDAYLFCDWDEAPAAMNFEIRYGDALARCADLVDALHAYGQGGAANPQAWASARELFILAPALVNVALNYRICVDFGLPLHPTQYFELDTGKPPSARYTEIQVGAAEELYASAIALARAAYRLDTGFRQQAAALTGSLPGALADFLYTSRADKYTWRGAEPAKVRSLAASVLKRGRPAVAIGAAHGSIMAGLLLAEILGCELRFLRFSMFKRNDKKPVITPSDEEYIRSFGDGSGILVFDEDSASGTTLTILTERVRELAPQARTGSVIRHATSSFKPDHVGRTWWD